MWYIPCTVPSMSPSNISAIAINSTSILVTWDTLPLISQNGIITKYEVVYTASMFSPVSLVNFTSTLRINLAFLEEYVEYSIRVRAHTEVGAGPFSQSEIVTTLEDGKNNPHINKLFHGTHNIITELVDCM